MFRTMTFISAVLIAFSAAACSAAPPIDAPEEESEQGIADIFSIPWDETGVFAANLVESERSILDELTGNTIYHIDILVDDDLNSLQGTQEVRYTNREDRALTELYFWAYPNLSGGSMTIQNASIEGTAVDPLPGTQIGIVGLPLSTALAPGEALTIRLEYSVEVPQEMSGNYGLFGHFGEFVVLQECYPILALYDDEGWNLDIPPAHGDLTYLDASYYLVSC